MKKILLLGPIRTNTTCLQYRLGVWSFVLIGGFESEPINSGVSRVSFATGRLACLQPCTMIRRALFTSTCPAYLHRRNASTVALHTANGERLREREREREREIVCFRHTVSLNTRTSSTIQCLVCHPAGQYGPSTPPLPQKTYGDLLGRLIFQLTPRSSMTQLFPCLVPTCPDGSGAFWTVSAQALADVQPVSISGVIPTTHCASVEPPRPCRTSSTAARYTSLKVVSLPPTQHLIPRWSGCATAAYAKERTE